MKGCSDVLSITLRNKLVKQRVAYKVFVIGNDSCRTTVINHNKKFITSPHTFTPLSTYQYHISRTYFLSSGSYPIFSLHYDYSNGGSWQVRSRTCDIEKEKTSNTVCLIELSNRTNHILTHIEPNTPTLHLPTQKQPILEPSCHTLPPLCL